MPLPRPADVTLVASETLFRGRIFDVVREEVRLPSGLRQDLELVRHAGAVGIAALDAEGRLVLVRQYRHAAGDWLLEIPAGRVEEGEDPLPAARRELEEETGLRAARWELLHRMLPAPGFCTERIHLFLARELEEVPGGGLASDADEELGVLRMTPADVLAAPLADAKTLVCAALLERARATGPGAMGPGAMGPGAMGPGATGTTAAD